MASLQTTPLLSSYNLRPLNAAIHVPKPPRVPFSVPKVPSSTRKLQIQEEFNVSSMEAITPSDKTFIPTQLLNNKPLLTMKLYAILEAVSDRVEMHRNVGEQRQNWNNLLLNSINMITLAATAMSGIASAAPGDSTSLKVSSALLFSAATGMLLIMNKIQPSQLAEEQRNATRLLKQLQSQIETLIAIGNPTEEDVKRSMEKVLALDRAYPLPLLGAMLEKFPKKYEAAVWWPTKKEGRSGRKNKTTTKNGWSEELEAELREVVRVVKGKDVEDYERLGNIALRINKTLAVAGPLLTGMGAVGSAFVGSGASWVPLVAGSLAAVINGLEHGGQVGMVFEMYRNCGGFFNLLEETIEATLQESDLDKRENGHVFEMKVAIKLGRTVSQLRRLASKSASCYMEGIQVDEFASKLF